MKRVCSECEFHKERGHWTSAKIHHCRTCHRSWTGTTQAHCTVCHSHFSSPTAFDVHIVGDTHTPPEHVRSKGQPVLFLREDKFGRTWSLGEADQAWWLRTQEGMEAQLPARYEDQPPHAPRL